MFVETTGRVLFSNENGWLIKQRIIGIFFYHLIRQRGHQMWRNQADNGKNLQ